MIRNRYLNQMAEWASRDKPKPLLLWGARQVGKTTLMHDFAKNLNADSVYLNFEADKQLASLFKDSLAPERILRHLSIYLERPIVRQTLLLFDEIQECDDALNSLKYFAESPERYNVIAAGSLLGVKHSRKGFPVGQVEFLDVYPLSFDEFLEMTGARELANYLREIEKPESFPGAIHNKLLERVKEYMWIGGMPEAVAAYARAPEDFLALRAIQQQILRTYQLDFAKYAPPSQVAKIGEVFAQIPLQIAKENKKFMVSNISKSARLREYGEALQWLLDAGMIHKVPRISLTDIPLSAHTDQGAFKLFMIDVGLVGAWLDVPVKTLLDQTTLFTSYKGALAESFVLQQLVSQSPGRNREHIFYWTGPGQHEVDFVVQRDGVVFPLEVKSGESVKSKSLKRFGMEYPSIPLSRTSTLNYRCDGATINYPLYAVQHFPAWTSRM